MYGTIVYIGWNEMHVNTCSIPANEFKFSDFRTLVIRNYGN